MIQKAFLFSIIFLLFVAGVSGQDPLKVAPQAYKLEFENEWVKVTRVHYAAHSTIPEHDHTQTGAAYVYLNDSGPVIFKHIGLSYGAVTRPATKAGSVRLYQAVKETHVVENPSDTPSDFLRVEFKTVSDSKTPLRGKFFRESYAQGENFQKPQFENEQIRLTRMACAKDRACEISAAAGGPLLVVGLSSSQLKSSSGGKGENFEPGKTKWIADGKRETVTNLDADHAEFLLFELKTKPLSEK